MSLPPGAVFAGFAIERLLGAGGMGSVYLAEHPRMRRQVALKVLADTFTLDPKTRNAFDREATVAARLDHPNIVPVYDRSDVDDPALWLAMRYIDGGDASGLLNDQPDGLAPARAVRLLADAAHALDYAHAQGVLHRDVKPANLLIENDRRHGERAVLTDFGIARTLDDTVTLSGIAATFAYAAPERFSDAPADHRADVYSLGCTLFQLLTGQPPFPRKDQAAVIGAHLSAAPPAPREVRPELPAALDAVIATALAKSPQARYPTCTALAEAAADALPSAAVTVYMEKPRPVAVSSGPAWGEAAVQTVVRDQLPPVPGEAAGPIVVRDVVSPPDEAAVPTVVRAVAAPVPRLPPSPEVAVEPAADVGGSTRRRRFAVVSGLFLAGVSVVVGATFALRGNSESPATTPGPTTPSAVVSQQVTSTTTPVQLNQEATSAPPPIDTPPPDTVVPPAEQPQYTAPATRPQSPATQAQPVVPQTRSHQWGE